MYVQSSLDLHRALWGKRNILVVFPQTELMYFDGKDMAPVTRLYTYFIIEHHVF